MVYFKWQTIFPFNEISTNLSSFISQKQKSLIFYFLNLLLLVLGPHPVVCRSYTWSLRTILIWLRLFGLLGNKPQSTTWKASSFPAVRSQSLGCYFLQFLLWGIDIRRNGALSFTFCFSCMISIWEHFLFMLPTSVRMSRGHAHQYWCTHFWNVQGKAWWGNVTSCHWPSGTSLTQCPESHLGTFAWETYAPAPWTFILFMIILNANTSQVICS